MPCAPSPPRAFCQEKVTTSSFAQSSFCANAAEVASQIVRPLREAAIQSPFGTRTPEVVPFQVKTTSESKLTFDKSGSSPYGALSTVTSLSLSCFSTSVTQPSPNDSQVSIVTGRAPSSDHSAISTAPVSDAGTMPMRYCAGTCSTSRVRSMARLSFALPALERWERPRTASLRACAVQPGRLAQGPDEKCGTRGRIEGVVLIMIYPSR